MESLANEFSNLDINLQGTYFCDYSHPGIQNKAKDFLKHKFDELTLIENIFLFVRDGILFGGDLWQVKASDTLKKGYGACYNKNLLLSSLLRACGVPTKFKANPMKKDFLKPAIGAAYLTVSTPFMHCFTEVEFEGSWFSIDPTLDKLTYDTCFAPLNVNWGIDWNGVNSMELYTESIIGEGVHYQDIDSALEKNLNSHFLFKKEPNFLLSKWLKAGNKIIWKKTGSNFYNKNRSSNYNFDFNQ
jgi:hypothetical protein